MLRSVYESTSVAARVVQRLAEKKAEQEAAEAREREQAKHETISRLLGAEESRLATPSSPRATHAKNKIAGRIMHFQA